MWKPSRMLWIAHLAISKHEFKKQAVIFRLRGKYRFCVWTPPLVIILFNWQVVLQNSMGKEDVWLDSYQNFWTNQVLNS